MRANILFSLFFKTPKKKLKKVVLLPTFWVYLLSVEEISNQTFA